MTALTIILLYYTEKQHVRFSLSHTHTHTQRYLLIFLFLELVVVTTQFVF